MPVKETAIREGIYQNDFLKFPILTHYRDIGGLLAVGRTPTFQGQVNGRSSLW